MTEADKRLAAAYAATAPKQSDPIVSAEGLATLADRSPTHRMALGYSKGPHQLESSSGTTTDTTSSTTQEN